MKRGNNMELRFIGEVGVYMPNRDAIRFTAISAETPIDCYIGRPGLMAVGSKPTDGPRELVEAFQKNRDLIERAAMIKLRRATVHPIVLDIDDADIRSVGMAWREPIEHV